jgi:hypothetical protein
MTRARADAKLPRAMIADLSGTQEEWKPSTEPPTI